MPMATWAVPVPALVMFATRLLEIVFGIVTWMSIPMACCAVAVGPVVVTWMLFAVVALPIELFVIVGWPPVFCSELMLEVTVAEPIAVSEPIVLFEITYFAPVIPEALMPTINEPLTVPVTVIAPFPVPLPTVFPSTLPMLALPDVTLMPVRAPLVVPMLMAVTVLFWMLVVELVPA